MNRVFISGFILFIALGCSKKDEEVVIPDPTMVSIGGIKVLTLPLTDHGSQWDIGSDADLYFQLENGTNVLYKWDVSRREENVKAEMLPVSFVLPALYQLPAIDQNYKLSLYDYDDLSDDDFMTSIPFNPGLYKKSRPDAKIFVDSSAQIEVLFSWK